ncbi:MAG: hypothetical protein ABEJ84_02970 [Halodesulfurarchaeum sp.]
MDLGRLFYHLLRLYVWGLVLLGLGTIVLLLLPRDPPSGALAGIWFAVGGFGGLVLVIAVLVGLYE